MSQTEKSFLRGVVFAEPENLELIDEYALSIPHHQLAYDREKKISLWVPMEDIQRLIWAK